MPHVFHSTQKLRKGDRVLKVPVPLLPSVIQ
jgi:hypothetical protein